MPFRKRKPVNRSIIDSDDNRSEVFRSCKVVLTRMPNESISQNGRNNGKASESSKLKRKTRNSNSLKELRVVLDDHVIRPSKKQKVDGMVTNGNVAHEKTKSKTNVKKERKNDCSSMKQETADDRCNECLQFFDDPDFKKYAGDPGDAVDELIMLTDSRLSIYTGESNEDIDLDEKPSHKITCFTVYDKHDHICQFDSGLIERSVDLYFSGYVKPIYSEDASITDGVPAQKLGPISEWWTAGFDGGDKALIGFSTAYSDYILMEPSPDYLPYMHSALEKIHMSKCVIEVISDDMDTSFDDLLETIQTLKPPKGVPPFSQDSLLTNAQFIIEQIQSYDSAGDDDEPLLVTTRCIRSLIRIAGATLQKKIAVVPRQQRSKQHTYRKVKQVNTDTKATTTSLVHKIIGGAFGEKIVEEVKNTGLYGKGKRCGACSGCQKPECGTCVACMNMPKFGGKGNNRLVCLNKVCLGVALQEAEEDEADLDEDIEDEMDKKASVLSPMARSKRDRKRGSMTTITWIGKPVSSDAKQSVYKSVMVNNEKLVTGDFVKLESRNPSNKFEIARIEYMYEDDEGNKVFHAHYFMLGMETVLGDTADKKELFMVDDCEDVPLSFVQCSCHVFQKGPPPNWFLLGGLDDPDIDSVKIEEPNTFFYQKWYDPTSARFVDPPDIPDDVIESSGHFFCSSCCQTYLKAQEEVPALGDRIKEGAPDSKHTYHDSVKWQGDEFRKGDCVFLDPDSFDFKVVRPPSKVPLSKPKVDEAKYPELYRKTSDYIRCTNPNPIEPFRIGRIISIWVLPHFSKPSAEKICLRISKFYRPENTHLHEERLYCEDLNLLYWSSEEVTIKLCSVAGKCEVSYRKEPQNCFNEYIMSGVCPFYFAKAYDSKTQVFTDVPLDVIATFPKRKNVNNKKVADSGKKLKMLDVFAGCGGLSEGFHQVGIAESEWAIEFDEAACKAFQQNNPNCKVYHENCNKLLKEVMEGKRADKSGKLYPQKGDVDILVGGPPCQGFSGMNRFNDRQYSAFKNSLIATYLSYCDFYRPKFFILENVRNFVMFKKNMVLKLTLNCLIRMGYQCTFGILQAGNYGVPQSRRRAIIIAAAPGEKLPFYPEPTTVFKGRGNQLSSMVDDKKYVSNIKWVHSAPYRMITVRDTMSDLPPIKNGARQEEMSYTGPPKSSFQKMVRNYSGKEVLRDHICKEMSTLVEARFRYTPCTPGADWRDLPNIDLVLPDGKHIKKLKYNYKDLKNGNSSKGFLRGVCACAEGKPCDPLDRQPNTLIPWCLPHTSNRHNNWAGLYGRLAWDGYFCTTVTNPEPMGKQGLTVHPEQDRVVSVRECARSQGFPDSYIFYGGILDRHKQIGNAVPPPLAAAIALEFKKSLIDE